MTEHPRPSLPDDGPGASGSRPASSSPRHAAPGSSGAAGAADAADPGRADGAADTGRDAAGTATATLVRLGVLVDPSSPTPDLQALQQDLHATYPDLAWDVVVLSQHLGDEEDDSLDLLESVRDRMLDEDWDLAVAVRNEALEQGRHTLRSQVSPAHAVGVLALDLAEEPVEAAVARVVGKILGLDNDEDDDAPTEAERRAASHAARQLATDVEDRGREFPLVYAWRVGSANLRLLWQTIRANRPWMLAATLSKSLSAALAAGLLTLLTTDLWMLSAEYNGLQMALVGALAILSVTVSMIVGAKLWERPRRKGEREQVTVFNIATVITVLIGVVVLHAALTLLSLAGALMFVDDAVFTEVTGDPVTIWQYVKLAWFIGGLATIGSALGAGLEDDDDIREAIFTRGSA